MADESTFGEVGTEEVPFDEGAGEEFESPDAGGQEEANTDPFGWAEGLDPAEIQKTYTKFTQKTQALSAKEKEYERMRDELAPLNKLRESLETDPGLVQAISDYFENGRTPQDEISEVKKELSNVKTSLQIEKELAGVSRWVKENGLPDFDEDELVAFAAQNRILNLQAAYKAQNFEAVQDRKAEQLQNDIKRGKNAALPKTGKGDSKGSRGKYSEQEIADMSTEEFEEKFADIYASFQ